MAELELWLPVTQGSQCFPVPRAPELSTSNSAHRQGKIGSFFFFFLPSTFAFQLIVQMEILFLNYPVSPFDLSTSGRRLFGYICFLKMRVKTGMEWGRLSVFFFFSFACPINIVSKTNKEINSYNIVTAGTTSAPFLLSQNKLNL